MGLEDLESLEGLDVLRSASCIRILFNDYFHSSVSNE